MTPTMDLVVVDKKTGVPVMDSRLAAKELGIEHKNVLALLKEHQEELGEVRVSNATLKTKGGNQKTIFALLTERQVLLLITMVRNSPEALIAKTRLVDAFLAMRQMLRSREISVAIRGELTDALRDSGENERMHGFAYKTYTDLIYRAVIGQDAKHFRESFGLDASANVRDHLTAAQLDMVKKYEDMVRTMVNAGISFEQVKATIGNMAVRMIEATATDNKAARNRRSA